MSEHEIACSEHAVETIHPEDRGRALAQFWAAARTDSTFRLEFRLNSDVLRWVTTVGSIEHDAHGVPTRIRGINHDITDRKEAELAVAERDSQLHLAGKGARVGNFAVDIATGNVQTSPGSRIIHGLPDGAEETTLDEWRSRMHPDDLPRVEVLCDLAFAERRREHNTEYRIVGPGGKVQWIESRGLVSYNGDGRPERIVGVNIDVTERKRAEAQQTLLVAELDHRVKNVLASVAAVAKRTGERIGSTQDFITALDRRLQSMAEAHALLSRSRWQGASLAALIGQELAPFAANGNTVVEGSHVALTAGATQALAMVLHELATNAAKYGALSTPQGRVSVRWEWQPDGRVPASLKLEWHERGGPVVVTAPAQTGYGTSVIRDLVPYELGGTVELEFASDGVRCLVVIPGEHAHHVANAPPAKLHNPRCPWPELREHHSQP